MSDNPTSGQTPTRRSESPPAPRITASGLRCSPFIRGFTQPLTPPTCPNESAMQIVDVLPGNPPASGRLTWRRRQAWAIVPRHAGGPAARGTRSARPAPVSTRPGPAGAGPPLESAGRGKIVYGTPRESGGGRWHGPTIGAAENRLRERQAARGGVARARRRAGVSSWRRCGAACPGSIGLECGRIAGPSRRGDGPCGAEVDGGA